MLFTCLFHLCICECCLLVCFICVFVSVVYLFVQLCICECVLLCVACYRLPKGVKKVKRELKVLESLEMLV